MAYLDYDGLEYLISQTDSRYAAAMGASYTGALAAANVATTLNTTDNLYLTGVTSDADTSLQRNSNIYINGSTLYAPTFQGDLSGNAATASKLGSSTVGSSTTPIYLDGGTATACGYDLATLSDSIDELNTNANAVGTILTATTTAGTMSSGDSDTIVSLDVPDGKWLIIGVLMGIGDLSIRGATQMLANGRTNATNSASTLRALAYLNGEATVSLYFSAYATTTLYADYHYTGLIAIRIG